MASKAAPGWSNDTHHATTPIKFKLPPTPKSNDLLYEFDFTIQERYAGTVTMQLFDGVTPLSVKHFISRINEYKGSTCDRLKTDGWLEFDIAAQDATTEKITIPDENFVIPQEKGTVSFVNNGPNSNSHKFMILMQDMPYFNGKYVAIGKIINGMNVISILNKVACTLDVPDLPINIKAVRKV